jgi:hypothetical protein
VDAVDPDAGTAAAVDVRVDGWKDADGIGGTADSVGGFTRRNRSASRTRLDLSQTARQYTWHGMHHILTGYDHLLFVAALVIAATSLWDLVKVVSAFTVSRTR